MCYDSIFSGIRTGVGIVSKRTGIGIAWNRFQSGIDSRAGIGSMAGIDSKCEKTPVYKYKYEIIFLAIIITNCLKNQQNIDLCAILWLISKKRCWKYNIYPQFVINLKLGIDSTLESIPGAD